MSLKIIKFIQTKRKTNLQTTNDSFSIYRNKFSMYQIRSFPHTESAQTQRTQFHLCDLPATTMHIHYKRPHAHIHTHETKHIPFQRLFISNTDAWPFIDNTIQNTHEHVPNNGILSLSIFSILSQSYYETS